MQAPPMVVTRSVVSKPLVGSGPYGGDSGAYRETETACSEHRRACEFREATIDFGSRGARQVTGRRRGSGRRSWLSAPDLTERTKSMPDRPEKRIEQLPSIVNELTARIAGDPGNADLPPLLASAQAELMP